MTAALCLLATCRVPGRHRDGCTADCRGCLPAQAADGLRLCQRDTDRIATDARQLADLYDELALRLLGGTGLGEPVSGSADSRLPSPAAVDMRTEIRHILASWCKLIAEERGFALPDDQVPVLGRYVATSARWLAATEYADEVASELGELRRRAWGIAYPSGTHTVHVGPCPEDGCGGTLTAVVRAADNQLPSEVVCDTEPAHRWDSTQWRRLDRLVSARKAAA